MKHCIAISIVYYYSTVGVKYMDTKKISILLKRDEGTKLDFKQKIDIIIESGKKELAKGYMCYSKFPWRKRIYYYWSGR